MKLGVSSYSFNGYFKQTHCSYFDMCDIAKEIGFDGMEFIDLDHALFGVTDDPMKTALTLREHCAKIGLEINAYTVGAEFLKRDAAGEVARLKRDIDVAAAMGAGVLRHDLASAPRDIPRYSWQDAVAEIAPHVRAVTEYAQAKGVITCSENHGRFFQDPERVEAMIRAVGHLNYGWLVDFGNFMGVDADIPTAVSIAAPYAVHAHAKDNLFKPGTMDAPEGWNTTRRGNYTRATVAGHGAVPIAQCIGILKRAGYDGYLSLEFEGWEDSRRAIETGYAYLKRLLAEGASR